MADIFLAWELGGGMGHVVPLSQLTQSLVRHGHRVHLALRDLSGAASALGPLHDSPQVRLWQAPIWLPQLHGAPQPVSYPELLFHAGYLDAARLMPLVQAWRQVLEAAAPALLVADHAPTALLASRGMPMRRAQLGTGFFLPPRVSPMPSFREWERVDPARLASSDARALATCNAVLASRGQPPLHSLHDLFDTDETFALTWPELDHYSPGSQGRADVRYWGTLPGRDAGATPHWPAGEGPRVLVYLKADYAGIDAVLDTLSRGPWRCLAYVPGLTTTQRQRLAGSGRLHFSTTPVSMTLALADADAVLCNAGSGTVCTALQAGVPVLMLPMHAEQMLFARRVVAAGAGGYLADADAGTRLAATLDRLLADPAFRTRARALAALHATTPDADVTERMAERCGELVRAPSTP
jgi:UDP:flavonoid glycosyltransferase YjiC (YdhE family)